ncbi:MAG TPA: hypothetical protein VLA82_14635 [Actinomycetota bacterium]|nr:hypothetical protein [Actinomycetota bacterium]
MADLPTNVVAVRLRLLDVWGGDDVVRELSLAELETSERGVAVGPAFYPWRRVVSYEWEVFEAGPDEGFARPRQLLVRVLAHGPDGPEEHRVAADRFEVGPWTISMVLPDRVDTETQRTVLRRVTMPWHRVLEYERMLAEAATASAVPDRPDLLEAPELADHAIDASEDDRVVIDVAAIERAEADATANDPNDDGTTDEPQRGTEREPVPIGTDAGGDESRPRTTNPRRKRPRAS